jgi:hypothetical protein
VLADVLENDVVSLKFEVGETEVLRAVPDYLPLYWNRLSQEADAFCYCAMFSEVKRG